MGLQTFVGAFSTGTGTGDVDVTTVGFQPSIVIFWWTGQTATTNRVGEGSTGTGTRLVPGYGFAASATASSGQRACCVSDLDGAADADTDACHIAGVICTSSGGGAFTGKATLTSFLSNGFRINISDAFPSDMRVGFLAIGGSDILNATVHDITEPGSTGAVDYVLSPTFQPDFLLFIGTQNTGAHDAAAVADSTLMLGVAKGTAAADQWLVCGSSDEFSATMDTDSYGGQGDCIGMMTVAGGNLNALGALSAFNSDGFEITWSLRAGSRRFHVLAIRGPQFAVGERTMSNVLNTNLAVSGFGFKPKAAMVATVGNAEDTGGATRIGWLQSVGAFDESSNEHAQGFRCQTGTAASTVTSILRTDEVVALVDGSTTGAVQALVGIQSIDADGFTLNQDDADSANGNWAGWWAIGFSRVYPAHIAGTAINAPTLAYRVDGANIASTSVNAPTNVGAAAQAVTSGTVAATAVNAPTVAYRVDGASLASTSVNAPTLAHAVAGASIATTVVNAPTVAYRVDGASIAGTALNAPTVAPGPVSVTTASLAATAVNAPALAHAVSGAHVAGTALSAPTLAHVVAGAHVSAGQRFAPTLAYAATAGHVAGTSLFAPTVVPGAVTVTGASVSSTFLFAPTLSQGAAVTSGTVSTTSLFAPIVAPGPVAVAGATLAGTAVNAPSVAYRVAAPSLAATTLHAPTLAFAVAAGTIGPTATAFTPALAAAVASGTILGATALFPPGVEGGEILAILAWSRFGGRPFARRSAGARGFARRAGGRDAFPRRSSGRGFTRRPRPR